MKIQIGKLQSHDLEAVIAIQREIYPEALIESASVFSSRLRLDSSYCLAAKSEGTLVGYLIAHGWLSNSPPALGAVLTDPELSEILYIHDLGVSRDGRGAGVGRGLIDHATAMAADDSLAEAQLIAVRGAESFWKHLGFDKSGASSTIDNKLQSYGSDSVWMTRPLG